METINAIESGNALRLREIRSGPDSGPAVRLDVREARKTADVVTQAADLVGRQIDVRVVLTRTPVLRQRVAEHSRAQFDKAGLPIVSYLRVSTTRQDQSGLGLEAQRAAIRLFADSEGFEVTDEFVEVETLCSKAQIGL